MSKRATTGSMSLRGYTSNRIERHDTSVGPYLEGVVMCAEGMAYVYSQDGYTRIDTVRGGRLLMRLEERGFTKRGLVTIARRWLRSLEDA